MNRTIRKSCGERVFQGFNASLMIALCVVMLYPYVNQLAISLNNGGNTALGGITIFPREFTFHNYVVVFSNEQFNSAVVTSVLRVLIGSLLALSVTTFAAYALSKKDLPGRGWIITFLIVPMFISGGLIPTFILFRYLELINSFWVYILPAAFGFYNMIIIRTYLNTLPPSLEESAMIDGAGYIKILWKIYLPLCMPVLATVGLWIAVGHWNDWTTTLYFMTTKEHNTLQFLMYKVLKESELIAQMASENARLGTKSGVTVPPVTPEAVKAATLIVSTVPILVIYPFLQKYFVKGVMIGSLKE